MIQERRGVETTAFSVKFPNVYGFDYVVDIFFDHNTQQFSTELRWYRRNSRAHKENSPIYRPVDLERVPLPLQAFCQRAHGRLMQMVDLTKYHYIAG